MTIARGQMNRQLYADGTPESAIEKLNIPPEERRLLERVLEKRSLDNIREDEMSDEDMEVMEMLMKKQQRPEYQYNENNPYMGPRPMRAGGGIMSIPRQQYGFGSFVSSIGGAIGDVLGGAADVVSDVVSEPTKILDPIAQVASFVPGPHQPFAAAYTAGRGSGIGGSDYGGFQIGGFTPSGSMFGTTPTSGPSLSSFNFMPQAGGQDSGIFDTLGSLSQFMPMEGPAPTGQETGGGIFDGIDPRILEAGMKIGTNILRNKANEKMLEKRTDQAYQSMWTCETPGQCTPKEIQDRIKIYGGAAISAAMSKLAYESQAKMLEDYRKDVEAQRGRVAEKKAEFAAATRPVVQGRPETLEDVVVRPAAAMGGIMGSRKGYMMGSEVPLRQNQAGITEMDYRQSGGFVPPIGLKEKADDIPAMLSNNEFVFTADAVRAAGGGSVNKGAQKMYALMKQLEGQA